MKVFAETYVHELCHALEVPYSHEHENPYTQAYYNTDFGKCEKNGYISVFGETPPHYRKVNSQPQSYEWQVQCMINVFNNPDHQDYFPSNLSAIAAWE